MFLNHFMQVKTLMQMSVETMLQVPGTIANNLLLQVASKAE